MTGLDELQPVKIENQKESEHTHENQLEQNQPILSIQIPKEIDRLQNNNENDCFSQLNHLLLSMGMGEVLFPIDTQDKV